jgi:hypothetical protein
MSTARSLHCGSTRAANTGVHTGHLYQADGTLLATQTFTNESGSGWQQVTLDTPVAINPGIDYVVSYYSPSGFYSASGGYFASSGVDSPPLHAPPTTATPNGVYDYGAERLPTLSFNGSNYWVDVVLETGPTRSAGHHRARRLPAHQRRSARRASSSTKRSTRPRSRTRPATRDAATRARVTDSTRTTSLPTHRSPSTTHGDGARCGGIADSTTTSGRRRHGSFASAGARRRRAGGRSWS